MTELLPSGKPLAVRLPDELRAQLDLIAGLDQISLAEAARIAIEDSITRRRESGELATRAQAALELVDREAAARRDALNALIAPAATTPAEGSGKPSARGRGEKAGA